MNIVLLLTSCVNPNGMELTVIQDPQVRLAQYLTAIQFYLTNTTNKIIYVDNSLTDLSQYFEKERINGRIEFLCFDGNKYEKSKGKGYGEALIIEHAIKCSKFLTEETMICKITGRLIIRNINRILKCIKRDDCIYANIDYNRKWGYECISTVFVSPPCFLRNYFLKDKEMIDDSKYYIFENHLFSSMKEWTNNKYKHKEFLYPFLYEGVSGSTGKQYVSGRYPYLRSFLKYFYHKLPVYFVLHK